MNAPFTNASVVGNVLFGCDDMVKTIVARGVGMMASPEDFGPSTALGILCRGKIVGGTVYNEFTGWSCAITTYVAPGTPHWCRHDTLHQLYRYPFVQLGVKRVECLIARNNRMARRMVRHMGFTEEGCHPLRYDGVDDAISYGMLRQNCPWLREKSNG